MSDTREEVRSRLSARSWPPVPHTIPATFTLGKETLGVLKSIEVDLLDVYAEQYRASAERADRNEFHWVVENNKKFDLCFYLPLETFNSPSHRVRELVIMLNGLNEIDNIHYQHYDRLGTALARRGFGAILYPTPFHLNRTPYLDQDFKEEYLSRAGHAQQWPQSAGATTMSRIPHKSMARRGDTLFCFSHQIKRELETFVSRLRRQSVDPKEDSLASFGGVDQLFFDNVFDRPNLVVHLLGYSFGGLQSLFTFLGNKSLFGRCVLMNSGASMDKLQTRPVRISDDDWKSIVNQALKVRTGGKPTDVSITNDSHERLLEVLFERPFRVQESIDAFTEVASELLFVAGGADLVSPAHHLARFLPEGGESSFSGLNVLQIAGLGHPLRNSLAYDRWFEVIASTVEKFLRQPRNADDEVSYDEMIAGLAGIEISGQQWDEYVRREQLLDDRDLNLFGRRVAEKMDDQTQRLFLKYYLISKRYFESDAELLRTLERYRQKEARESQSRGSL